MPKNVDQQGIPEVAALHVAKQREMVQVPLANQGDDAAQSVRLEFNVGIGENEILACGRFVRFLERMWFAQPSGGQITEHARP